MNDIWHSVKVVGLCGYVVLLEGGGDPLVLHAVIKLFLRFCKKMQV